MQTINPLSHFSFRSFIAPAFLFLSLTAFSACGGGDDEPSDPNIKPKPENPETPSAPSIFDTYSADNIYSRNVRVPQTAFMQGFSIADDGSVWYTSCKGAELHISHRKVNKGVDPVSVEKDHMTLTFFGHGTNSAIEECDGEAYVWAGCYGSCTEKENYWKEKLICRTKFLPGRTINTDQCDEYYFIGEGAYNVQPSVDTEHGRLAVQFNGLIAGNTVNFLIYDLEQAKNAPLRDVTIKCTDGFITGERTSTKMTETVVKVHDLTAITPIATARCAWKTDPRKTYYSWQGYDINGDRIYFVEGNDNGFDMDKTSQAYLTVYSITGSILEPRTQIKAISDIPFLSENSVSTSGTLESEGVKVKNGTLYLGFCNRGVRIDNRNPYQTIFSFTLK